MPVMDGIQAMEKICTMSFAVPIIAVMAYAFYTELKEPHETDTDVPFAL